MAAGAVGLCCAKLGEAEALAAGGLDRLLLTAPVLGDDKIRRLLALNAVSADLAVVIDDADNARQLADAAAAAGQVLSVLIVADVGSHRFGVTSEAAAVEIGRLIAAQPSLRFRGVQGYAGHVQHIEDYADRREQSHAAVARLGRIRDALAEAGWQSEIVTGSGTGTHDFDQEPGIMTDLQVGSYVFCDVQYDRVTMSPEGGERFRRSLFVHTRVVSANHAGFVTTDAGSKSFAMDGPAPEIVAGRAARSHLRSVRRRVRPGEPAGRRHPAARHPDRLRGAALRSDREPLRPLPLRARRRAGRSVAGRRARPCRLMARRTGRRVRTSLRPGA